MQVWTIGIATKVGGQPNLRRMSQSRSWLTVSNAFVRSTKAICQVAALDIFPAVSGQQISCQLCSARADGQIENQARLNLLVPGDGRALSQPVLCLTQGKRDSTTFVKLCLVTLHFVHDDYNCIFH